MAPSFGSPPGFLAPRAAACQAGRRWLSLVEEVAQGLGARRVTQFRHGLRLDLADALTGHAVHAADVVKGLRLAVLQAVAHLDDARLTRAQRLQHLLELLLQQ